MNDGQPLPAPSGLSVNAMPGSVNQVTFGSAGGDINYEIWRRHGDTVDWYLHATISEPLFSDAEVKPGQYYEYKVRAVLGDSVSEFSPSAVAYGAE
jgi:hypothetical protein